MPGIADKTPGIPLPLELPPLEHPDSIRLFQLYVGDNDEPYVEGQLITCELTDPLDYSALSHVWESKERKKTIVIDGRNVDITANLFNCLMALRGQAHANPTKYPKRLLVWVDALCIDQGSVAEKTQQVQIMGKIFQAATSVIAFLGPFEKDLPLSILGSKLAPSRNDQIRLLRILSEHVYFTRLWIVTECLCARKLYFMSDKDVMSEKVLYQALNYYVTEQAGKARFDMYSSMTPDFTRTTMWTLLSMRRSTKADRDLLSLVDKFQKHECAIPQDKVFALMAIASPPSTVPIDYAKDLVKLFYSIVIAHEGTKEWAKVEGLRKSLKLQSSDLVLKAGDPDIRSAQVLAGFKYICRIGADEQLKGPSSLSLTSYFKSASKWSLVLKDDKNVNQRITYMLLSGEVKNGDVVVAFHGHAPLLILRGQDKFKVVGVADADVLPFAPQDRHITKKREALGAKEQLSISSFSNTIVDWEEFRNSETISVNQPTWVDLYWRAATRDPLFPAVKLPKTPIRP